MEDIEAGSRSLEKSLERPPKHSLLLYREREGFSHFLKDTHEVGVAAVLWWD